MYRPRSASWTRTPLRALSQFALVGALAALLPLAASAQATGTLTGSVTNASTGEAIAGAQISIPGTGLGTLTNNVGRYILLNVPAGSQTVRAEFIGFGAETATVQVTSGQSTQADFELRSEAISLEGVIVTGTAGAARRKEIGNSVAQINSTVIETAPIQDVGDLLQGRAAGATVLDNSGQIGAGNTIKLRGNNSVSQGNSPLIYVDGVRMRNTAFPGDPEQNQSPNPLQNINPNDIERVEVIKGAAATTLYGTEAAGGVIQIFTKRGAAGAPAWSFTMDQGINTMRGIQIGPDDSFDEIGGFGPVDGSAGLGFTDCANGSDPFFPVDESCPAGGDWLRNGHLQNYNLSVRGGAETMNYFLSASYGDERGVIDGGDDYQQGQESWSLRGNFGFRPTELLDIRFNTMYSHKAIDWLPDGNNAEGLALNIMRGTNDYTSDRDGDVLDMQLSNLNDHFMTGVNMLFTPNVTTHRLNAGIDWARATFREERPWGFFYVPLGNREVDDFVSRKLTLDYSGTWDTDFGESLSSSFSWGGQLYNDFLSGINGFGDDFAGPGDKVLESGARTEAFEYNTSITNGGFFIQEMVGINDQLFITAGVRVDGHSAFGTDFGWAPYPKISAAWSVSDNSFYPEALGTLKLRAALGESGKAPGTFDAVKTWDSRSGDEGQPAVTPDNLGNPELGPERTREWEVGFEGAALDGRLSFEYTYYNQRTYDALINVVQTPSAGFVGNQLENVGELKNTGHEIFLNANVLNLDGFTWDLGGQLATNSSEVLDLGGLESINLGWRNYVRVGQPLPVFCHDRVQNPDEVGAAPVYDEECLGATTPTKTLGLNTSMTFADRVTFDVVGEGMFGHVLSSGVAYQNTRRGVWPMCRTILNMIDNGQRDQLTAGQRAYCDPSNTRYGMWTNDADFFKIRSASLAFRVPESILPSNIRGATLRLQGRNLFRWTEFYGIDPESFEDGSGENLFRQEYYNLPPFRTFLVSVKLDF